MNQNSPSSARSDRKKQRDKRVAALSLDLVPQENQRTTRIATQVLLADDLHESITVCLKEGLLMPIASLLRSLIDTTMLGLWFVKYSSEDQVTDSVQQVKAVGVLNPQTNTITVRSISAVAKDPPAPIHQSNPATN